MLGPKEPRILAAQFLPVHPQDVGLDGEVCMSTLLRIRTYSIESHRDIVVWQTYSRASAMSRRRRQQRGECLPCQHLGPATWNRASEIRTLRRPVWDIFSADNTTTTCNTYVLSLRLYASLHRDSSVSSS